MAADMETAEEQSGGAPAWMMTYGDSVTLLLTFFVLLLTFSTPNEEHFQQFTLGLLRGSSRMGVFESPDESRGLGPDQRRMAAGRMDELGAEKPPSYSEAPLEQLKHHYAEVDVAELRDLKGAVLIRIPLVELFGTGLELTPEGRKILDHVVMMTHARTYSVVVWSAAGPGLAPPEKGRRSLLFASRVVAHLRAGSGRPSDDIGVSDNVQLAKPPLPEGQCEIIMLEI
ncbi:MAG: flagellar motor protein MotB [Planctomycetota bacterium]|jgi:hypothetical protein